MMTWSSSRATNALRMNLPRSVRIGMFCRFGSDDESRPVSVNACAYVVCTRPWSSINVGNLSTYVDLSFVQARYSRMDAMIGCSPASFESVFSSVDHCPLAVFLPPGKPSLPKSSSPSCFGLSGLNPGSAYFRISCVKPRISRSSSRPYSFSAPTSIFTPSRSISRSTFTSGSSTSESAEGLETEDERLKADGLIASSS